MSVSTNPGETLKTLILCSWFNAVASWANERENAVKPPLVAE